MPKLYRLVALGLVAHDSRDIRPDQQRQKFPIERFCGVLVTFFRLASAWAVQTVHQTRGFVAGIPAKLRFEVHPGRLSNPASLGFVILLRSFFKKKQDML